MSIVISPEYALGIIGSLLLGSVAITGAMVRLGGKLERVFADHERRLDEYERRLIRLEALDVQEVIR